MPDTFTGNSRAISADGRYVYTSNHGNDSIATYSIDAGGVDIERRQDAAFFCARSV